jgi:thioredoxin 1
MWLSVSEQTFDKEVLASPQPVLVYFWAPWCGLCRAIDPFLVKLKTDLDRPLKIVSINADENLKLANAYRLSSLPTLLLFEGGCLRQRLDNFHGREGIQRTIEKMMIHFLAQSA